MENNKRNKVIYLYYLLFLNITISGLVMLISTNVVVDIFAFVILAVGAMAIVKFDISHPYVWYSFVFMIYSISYPILYLNDLTYDVYSYTKSLMFSQWLALATFLIVVSPLKVNYSKLEKIETKIVSNKKITAIISLVLILAAFIFATGGYSHKNEIYEESSILAFVVFRLVLVYLMLYAINLTNASLSNSKLKIKEVILPIIIIFLLVFYSGERDLIIRALIILIFVYYILVKKRILTKEVISLGMISLSTIPILAKYKYYGLTGVKTESDTNFFLTFLMSDFSSASKNLQILLLDGETKSFFKGKTILSSVLRTFNLDKLIESESISSGGWYNDRYFTAGRAGQGFTLVGEGYVNFGYLGIVLIFVIVGFLIRWIYTRSNRGVYYFVFYILAIPVFMYSIRADLANILSPLIKQNLLTLIILKIGLDFLYITQNNKQERT